jgi:hypothetical protein
MKPIHRTHPRLTPLAFALLALTVSMPAFAETEIESLKRELAEQKQLIQKILAAQEAQKTQDIQTGGANRGAGLQAAVPTGPAIPALTIYGVADVDLAHTDSGFGGKTNLGSGGYTASRLVEAGLSLNTGTVGTGTPTLGINNTVPSTGALTSGGTQFFSRQIYAGLSTPVGTITAGRQYSGSYLASVSDSTAMGAGLYGSSATLLPVIASMPTRLNNSLVYLSPKMRGVTAQVTLTTGSGNNVSTVTGNAASSTTDQAGRGADLALFYANGPFKAAVTAWNVKTASFTPALGETGLATRKGFQGGVNYDFGIAKVYATYVQGKIAGGGYEQGSKTLSNASGWSVSAGVPVAAGTVLASFARVNDKSLIPNKDVDQVGVAYTYRLYDATTLYGSWGKLLNKSNASYSLSNGGDLVGTVSPAGFNPSGLMVGLNQVF